MNTIKQLAPTTGVSPSAIRKRLENNGIGKFGYTETLPTEALEQIESWYRLSGNSENSPPQKKAIKKSPPKKVTPSRGKEFTVTDVVAIGIIIAGDGLSCGWIAYNNFLDFKEIAALIFFMVGIAIGYAAVKNTTSYDGYNSDNIAVWFGIFQAMIHLSAFQIFNPDSWGGDISFSIGKVIIAVAIAFANYGLSVTKKQKP